MSDLISRSALIELLQKNMSNDIQDMVITENNINLIRSMPTAYDEEKVVAELEERRKCSQDIGLSEFMENGRTTEAELFRGKANAYSDAIEIVRKGGVDSEK